MLKKFYKKKLTKESFFVGVSLIIVIACGFLIVLSLTFLIKNINLVFKSLPEEDSSLRFNIPEAERLFLQDK